jgi:hypothetical protein
MQNPRPCDGGVAAQDTFSNYHYKKNNKEVSIEYGDDGLKTIAELLFHFKYLKIP